MQQKREGTLAADVRIHVFQNLSVDSVVAIDIDGPSLSESERRCDGRKDNTTDGRGTEGMATAAIITLGPLSVGCATPQHTHMYSQARCRTGCLLQAVSIPKVSRRKMTESRDRRIPERFDVVLLHI